MIEPMTMAEIDQQQLAQQLVESARSEGVELVGPDGMLTGLTKQVLETALEAEMTEHLGYGPHDPAGQHSGNSRNGTRAKTVQTEIGPVQIEVPRDRDGSFEPQLVKKRQRRLSGIDEIVLSLTARGLTTGEVAAHFAEVYGAKVSKDTISRITDKVVEEMAEWRKPSPQRTVPRVGWQQPSLCGVDVRGEPSRELLALPGELVVASFGLTGQGLSRVPGDFATVTCHVGDRDGLPARSGGSGRCSPVRVACCSMAAKCTLTDFAYAKLAAGEREGANQRFAQARIVWGFALKDRQHTLSALHRPHDQFTPI